MHPKWPFRWAPVVLQYAKDRLRRFIGESPSVCAMWTPQCGEKKGGLCFVKRKDKSFLSNNHDFVERKWGKKEKDEMYEKSCGLSFDSPLLRRKNSLLFWRNSRVCFSLVAPGVFPHACRCAGADTRSCIAHSASLKYLPSPFTFTTNGLIYSWLCVKVECFLVLHRWREAWGEAFTHKGLSISWLSSTGEEVKAKNEKRRTRAYTRAQ